jgi:thiamine biosynthesis lipoprotein
MKIAHTSRFVIGLSCWLPCVSLGLGLVHGAEPGPGADTGAQPVRFEFTETHMGSEFKIVLYTDDASIARSASRAAFDRIAALDATLSDYQPESELMRLCERAGGLPVPVSNDLFDVLDRSWRMSGRSDGAFDATVGPVVRLWRRARRDRKMPDPDRLAQARALVGWDQLRLDPKARTVQLLKPGMKLDLGGIAKGYASEQAIAVLAARGIRSALVAGAGDIRVGAPPPDAPGWTIGVGPLESPGAPPRQFLRLKDAAVSTSGDAERYVEIGGRRYSHIVDPKTGLGVVDRCSVTVVASDGATADSLDTAVYVLGPERGLALVEATEGAAALIVRLVDGKTETFASRRLKDFLAEPPNTNSPREPSSTRP